MARNLTQLSRGVFDKSIVFGTFSNVCPIPLIHFQKTFNSVCDRVCLKTGKIICFKTYLRRISSHSIKKNLTIACGLIEICQQDPATFFLVKS